METHPNSRKGIKTDRYFMTLLTSFMLSQILELSSGKRKDGYGVYIPTVFMKKYDHSEGEFISTERWRTKRAKQKPKCSAQILCNQALRFAFDADSNPPPHQPLYPCDYDEWQLERRAFVLPQSNPCKFSYPIVNLITILSFTDPLKSDETSQEKSSSFYHSSKVFGFLIDHARRTRYIGDAGVD